jgi:hypothetical protein
MSADRERRWSKFWWQDYERDPALRACSLSAQGLWMRMLCFMHDGEPYGHLVVNGRVPDTKRLAAMIGKAEREVGICLAELDEAGVFSRTADGTIYSRRLVRDKAISDEATEHGSKGAIQPLSAIPTDPLTPRVMGGGLTPPDMGEGYTLESRSKSQKQKQETPLGPPLGRGGGDGVVNLETDFTPSKR